MATVGVFTTQGNISGGQQGSLTIGPNAQTFGAAVGTIQQVALVNGSVTVTVPTGSTLMVFAPPNAVTPIPNPAYSGTISLPGSVPVSTTYWSYLAWDTATTPASIVFTATAVGTAYCTFW